MSWFDDESFWCQLRPFIFPPSVVLAAAAEVDWILKLTGFKGEAILDLCCGLGRHSIAFAAKGYHVTAVDLSAGLLEIAKQRAKHADLDVDWQRADMRSFVRPSSFDLCVNLYNSFGYFVNPADDALVLQHIHESLRKGGALVIETAGKELLAASARGVSVQYEEGSRLYRDATVDANWETLTQRWCLVHKDTCDNYTFQHNIFSGAELRRLLTDNGFHDVHLYGSYSGDPYNSQATKLVAVGFK